MLTQYPSLFRRGQKGQAGRFVASAIQCRNALNAGSAVRGAVTGRPVFEQKPGRQCRVVDDIGNVSGSPEPNRNRFIPPAVLHAGQRLLRRAVA